MHMVADSSSLSKLVPVDFLEGWSRTPARRSRMGQWSRLTIDPAELDKRIQELRTVQYWLEQNARACSARRSRRLEVQRHDASRRCRT